jgi:hypothetical protein
MRIVVVLILIAVLSACATKTLDKGLPYLVGQPFDAAVAVLGEPTESKEKSGRTFYQWEAEYNGAVPVVQGGTSQPMGSPGAAPSLLGATTYMPVNHICRIQLAVDESGIIQDWNYSGNQGGCQYYEKSVRQLIPKQ